MNCGQDIHNFRQTDMSDFLGWLVKIGQDMQVL